MHFALRWGQNPCQHCRPLSSPGHSQTSRERKSRMNMTSGQFGVIRIFGSGARVRVVAS